MSAFFLYRFEEGEWVRRKSRATCLGRLMHINPSPRNMEMFHLRMLLLNRRGMQSFKELLTVDHVLWGTFQEACTALGLEYAQGFSYADALAEVVTHGSPWQIRRFFGMLLAQCVVSNIGEMWIRHRVPMAEDFVRAGVHADNALRRARLVVLRCVREVSDTVAETVAPQLTVPVLEGGELVEIAPEGEVECTSQEDRLEDGEQGATNCSAIEDALAHMASYNEEQAAVHATIMASVTGGDRGACNLITLMSPAGCGKTYVYNGLIKDCEAKGLKVRASVFTAIGACLVKDADTIHSTYGIPIRAKTNGSARSFYQSDHPEAELLKEASLILIDEVSMLAKWQAIVIDEFLRVCVVIRTVFITRSQYNYKKSLSFFFLQLLMDKPNVPMGGKTVVMGGDMAQILPILKDASVYEVEKHALPSWPVWRLRQEVHLTVNMRALEDPAYAEWLGKVRDGSANFGDTDYIFIPEGLLVQPRTLKESGRTRYRTAKDGNIREEMDLIDPLVEKV